MPPCAARPHGNGMLIIVSLSEALAEARGWLQGGTFFRLLMWQ